MRIVLKDILAAKYKPIEIQKVNDEYISFWIDKEDELNKSDEKMISPDFSLSLLEFKQVIEFLERIKVPI